MKTSKSAQSTIAEKVTIQYNLSYSITSDRHVKVKDDPTYSSCLYHQVEIQDNPSHSEHKGETQVYDIPSKHQRKKTRLHYSI